MSHTEDHRRHLRKTGFWGRRAAGCLFLARASSRLCFALRSKHALDPHTYGTWGGAIDGSESPAKAVIREIWEETGYGVGEPDLQPLFVFRKGDQFEYHNFLVTVEAEFSPVLNWENAGFVWADIDNWPAPLHFGAERLKRDSTAMRIIRNQT